MYAHPKTITEEIVAEIASNKKVCNYIDLPTQHINNRILQLMNRGVDREQITRIITMLKNIKQISLRTTVIVGFPTETEDEFKELMKFLKQVNFDWLGVFPYSCEHNTGAAKLKQLPQRIIDERYNEILALQKITIEKNSARRIGKIYKTLIHSQNGYYIGHTEFGAPDIDGQVISDNKKLKIGQFYDLKIEDTRGADLYANTD